MYSAFKLSVDVVSPMGYFDGNGRERLSQEIGGSIVLKHKHGRNSLAKKMFNQHADERLRNSFTEKPIHCIFTQPQQGYAYIFLV